MNKLKVVPLLDQLRPSPATGSSKSLRGKPDDHDQRRHLATLNATALVGRFRKCEADEPAIYFGALECVLARYDMEIQTEAIKPGTWKFPPTDFELRERCEAIANARERARQRDERIRKQLEERRRLDAIETERKALTHRPREPPAEFWS